MFEQKSVALVCTRLPNPHTAEKIVEKLTSIHIMDGLVVHELSIERIFAMNEMNYFLISKQTSSIRSHF